MRYIAIFSLILLSALSCKKATDNNEATTASQQSEQTIYFGGDILTMEDEEPQYIEAVVEREGKIVFTGSKEEALSQFKGKAKEHDLKGATMLPGFIEPHVHPSIAAIMLPNEIIAPYDWVLPNGTKKGVEGQEAFLAALTESVEQNASPDALYFIWGYHQLWHGDISREMLNEISSEQPIGLIHRSFHEIYLNDAAIKVLDLKEDDYNNNPQVNWEKGHFFEGGWMALLPKLAPLFFDAEKYTKGLGLMTQLALKNGITTMAEPGFPSSDFDLEYKFLKQEMDKTPPYDIYLIPNGTQLYGMKGNSNEAVLAFIDSMPQYDTDNITFLTRQVKLFSDGAIYSLLMQMKEPYLDGHHGEWITPLDLYQTQSKFYWDKDFKLHVHANGDLGIQMVVDDVRKLAQDYPRTDHQLTLHHMGYFSDEMAAEIAELGIEASVNPYYLWALADKYAEVGLGPERAENLVRINSLVSRNIPVSFHSDFSMAPMEPLTLAWTAVNRHTSKNSTFSQDQRVKPYAALKGITIDAARTLSQEDKIGSIKEGKTANFTILAENPLKTDPMHIKDIAVKGVVFKGQFRVNKAANLRK